MAKVSKRVTKERVRKICDILNETYTTEYKCYLNHENAWQLLIATMLSAQCTDARVNIVTEKLFKKYTSLEAFARADIRELERDIYSTGFYKNKAKNIIGAAGQIIERHGGEVPESIEELTALDGVGRKTANVIRGNIFHEPSIVVDTHVKGSPKIIFDKERRSGENRARFDEGAAERAVDSLQYSDHYPRKERLYRQTAEMRGMYPSERLPFM